MITGPPEQAERDRLHRLLDDLLDLKLSMTDATGDWSSGNARSLIGHAASFASVVIGTDALTAGYLAPPDAGDRAAVLRTLAHRLVTASRLFGRHDNLDDRASLNAAALEARAVLAGDDPQVFAKMSQYKTRYRVSLGRLRALEWDAYLDGIDVKAFLRRAVISEHFGRPWDTIRKWDASCRAVLSDKTVDDSLRWAKRMAEHSEDFWGMKDGDWRAAVKRDGEHCQATQEDDIAGHG